MQKFIRTCHLKLSILTHLVNIITGIGILVFPSYTLSQEIKIYETSITELQALMQSGQLTSSELVSYYLSRIDEYDHSGPSINAISSINPQALDIARKLDQERTTKGPRGPLHGIPMVVKDNYETDTMPTTAGSILFANWNTGHDATLVKRLKDAGAIIIAKTNMHEYAMGLKTVGSLFGQTLNPYALNRYPGGSSGGTSAAVAANFALAGMGSDTCGSIRIPAANNSLVGLRGTQGLTSRTGIFPLSHSEDFGGPLSRNVTDLAILFDVLAGYDPEDPQTAASVGNVPESYTHFLNADGLEGVRLGLLTDFLEEAEVTTVIRRAMVDLEKQGATVIEYSWPELVELLDNSGGLRIIMMEFKLGLNDYLSRHPSSPYNTLDEIILTGKFDLDLDPKLRRAQVELATDSKEYYEIITKRKALKETILDYMARNDLDALVYPSLAAKIAIIGEEQAGNNCFLSSNSGLPAISVPAGYTVDGIPVGLEMLARAWQESRLFQLAYAYEQATKHRHAPVNTPPIN
jgi:amidase